MCVLTFTYICNTSNEGIKSLKTANNFSINCTVGYSSAFWNYLTRHIAFPINVELQFYVNTSNINISRLLCPDI